VRQKHLGKAILICRVAHIQPVGSRTPFSLASFKA
jgi:hypothetical protein